LDGRPNIVMEANACGVPAIGAPVGGIPELIEGV
jgi:glycosyltransferase involved in cell wall biosynthesis